MGLLSNFFGRVFSREKPSHSTSEIQTDLKLARGKAKTSAEFQAQVRETQRPAVGTLSYSISSSARGWPSFGDSDGYVGPLYNLGEIAKAVDVESYLAVSVRRHRELTMKEGWKLVGQDKEALKYIRRRIYEIELMTGEPFSCLIREALSNLITYSNTMIVLKRDKGRSTGQPIRMFGKTLEPVSAAYVADTTTMSVKKNDFGRPVKWKQTLHSEGKTREYKNQDVIHIFLDRKSGFTFGTPFCIPVLDDIRALRRIEELVETVTHKHTFPMFHAKVGTEAKPAGTITLPGGEVVSEVVEYRNQIDILPPEGGLVTSERVELKLIGTEGQVLDLEPYLRHFENRVMGGLRVSGIDLGRGDTANKGTATSMTRNLIDACVEIQNVVSEVMTQKFFDILLLEGGYSTDEENRVHLRFPSIDREELRAHQNHGADLFLKGLITHDEFRRDYLRSDEMSDEDLKRTNLEMFEKKRIEMGKTDLNPTAADSENKTRPTNQSGTKATKTKVKANDGLDDRRFSEEAAGEYLYQLDYHWNSLMREFLNPNGIRIRNNKVQGPEGSLKRVLNDSVSMMVQDSRTHLTDVFERGYVKACEDMDVRFDLAKSSVDSFFAKHVRTPLIRLNRKAMISLGLDINSGRCTGNAPPDPYRISGVFGALEGELARLGESQTDQAYKIGYLEALRCHDRDKVKLVPDIAKDSGSPVIEAETRTIDVDHLKNSLLLSVGVRDGSYLLSVDGFITDEKSKEEIA